MSQFVYGNILHFYHILWYNTEKTTIHSAGLRKELKMLLDYKRVGTVREIERRDPKADEGLVKSKNFTKCGEVRTIPIKNIVPNPIYLIYIIQRLLQHLH